MPAPCVTQRQIGSNIIIMHDWTENIGTDTANTCFMLVSQGLATAMETVDVRSLYCHSSGTYTQQKGPGYTAALLTTTQPAVGSY